MNVNEYLRAIAGIVVLVSVLIGRLVTPWGYLLTAFVGLNLFQSAFTKWCPMMAVLKKLGIRE
jgi:hypothetical protein